MQVAKKGEKCNVQDQNPRLNTPNTGRPATALPDALQDRLGNRSVSALLRSLQAKHEVSRPDDPEEREADAVAERVMHAPAKRSPVRQITPTLEETVHRTKSKQGTSALSTASDTYQPIKSPGSGLPLSDRVRSRVEPVLDADLSHVRVHEDFGANKVARSLHAKAFTHQNHIWLGAGQSATDARLMAHEATHVIQQTAPIISSRSHALIQRLDEDYLDDPVVPQGYTFVPDPDQALIPEEGGDVAELEADLLGLEEPFNYHFHTDHPDIFFVPGTLNRRAIAVGLFDDAARISDFDFVGIHAGGREERGVRIRSHEALSAQILTELRSNLNTVVVSDANWVVNRVRPSWISDSDEWKMTERILAWSQRSYLRDASGTNYFDVFLARLQNVQLREEHWFTSDTELTALNWVLNEVGSKHEQILKAIALRSERFTSSYRVTDTTPEFDRGDVIGRFYWGAGSGIQLRVLSTLVNESTLQRAEIATRIHSVHGMKVVVPGRDGNFYGYLVGHVSLDPLIQDPLDYESGNFYWYYPGTIFIHPGVQEAEFEDTEEMNAYRRTLLSQLLVMARSDPATGKPNPIFLLNLDIGTLAQATATERAEIFELVLAASSDRGFQLLARVLVSTPDAEFPAFERTLTSRGSLQAILNGGGASKILLGQVFTQKTLASIPIGVDALTSMPTIALGKTEDWRYAGDVRLRSVQSEIIAPEDWDPESGPQVGYEPALPGETPGPVNRNVIEFRPISQERGWFPETREGTWGSASLPTSLIRIELPESDSEVRIVTAFEAACIASVPDWAAAFETLGHVAIAWSWYFAGVGFARAFTPSLSAGIAAGGWRAGLAAATEHAGTQVGRAALRRFAGEAILLSSMQMVDAYRDDLQKTAAGRSFLAVYNVAIGILVARDAWRLLNSGIVGRLAIRGWAAIASIPSRSANRLRQTVQNLEAANLAWSRMRQAGELVPATTGEVGRLVPRTEDGFLTYYRQAQAEVAAQQLSTALGSSGASTTTADRVMASLQRLRSGSPELARAQRDIARKATEMLQTSATDANALLLDVERTINVAGSHRMRIAGFLQAATRTSVPGTYLAEIRTLLARPGLDGEAIGVLSAKAERGSLDLVWLNRTTLSDADLQFLAVDPNTPWRLFQRAAEEGVSASGQINWRLRILSRGRIRGDAAEMMAPGALGDQVAGASVSGRQVRMENAAGMVTEADFAFSLGGLRHGLEVKGWSVGVWERAIAAAQARLLGPMTASQADRVQKFDHLVRQLTVIRDATGQTPYLAMTSGLSAANRTRLLRLLREQGLANVELVLLTETEILAVGRRLRGAMGVY